MNDKVYKPMPVTMDQPEEKISNVFNEIPEEVVKKLPRWWLLKGRGLKAKRIRL
jgi:hypothetical protein